MDDGGDRGEEARHARLALDDVAPRDREEPLHRRDARLVGRELDPVDGSGPADAHDASGDGRRRADADGREPRRHALLDAERLAGVEEQAPHVPTPGLRQLVGTERNVDGDDPRLRSSRHRGNPRSG